MIGIKCYASAGYEGRLIDVEVDLRRGIPGIDIVGLPDSAIKESRERIRVAIRNAGYDFPPHRILVNLAPAGIRKEGAAFDLPIALGILLADKQLEYIQKGEEENSTGLSLNILVMGELQLSGGVRGVNGVLAAAATGAARGIDKLIVAPENLQEVLMPGNVKALTLNHLKDLPRLLNCIRASQWRTALTKDHTGVSDTTEAPEGAGGPVPFHYLKGQPVLKRALQIAAAGGHHLLMFGPPGSGKSMAARVLCSLLPDISREKALEVSRLHSLAGILKSATRLETRPPFRMPHHSASVEGILGGGRVLKPGEVSLAHNGVLFLDEVLEFGKGLLQSLREPVENRKIVLSRAGQNIWYPASFQLVMAANPCPCGNLHREEFPCLCTPQEILNYWSKLGGAMMDRIDLRAEVPPLKMSQLFSSDSEDDGEVHRRISRAREMQHDRFGGTNTGLNSDIPPHLTARYVRLGPELQKLFIRAVEELGFSARASHSVLKVARTIADLEGRPELVKEDIFEALAHRRFDDQVIRGRKRRAG